MTCRLLYLGWMLLISGLVVSKYEDFIGACDHFACFQFSGGSLITHTSYPAVSECPKTLGVKRRECLGPVGNSLNTLDVTPMTDLTTEITYKNAHCVLCNGISSQRLTFWNFRLKCWSSAAILDESTYKIVPAVARDDDCEITFRAPNKLLPDISTAAINNECNCMISTCNVTGLVKAYSYNIFQNCVGERTKEVPVIWRGIAFKNSYCAKCNDQANFRSYGSYIPAWSFSSWIYPEKDAKNDMHVADQCPLDTQSHDLQTGCPETRCSPVRRLLSSSCKLKPMVVEVWSYRVCLRLTPRSRLTLINAIQAGYLVLKELHGILHEALKYDDIMSDVAISATRNDKDPFAIDIFSTNFLYFDWHFKIRTSYQTPEKNLISLVDAVTNATDFVDTFSIQIKDFKGNYSYVSMVPACLSSNQGQQHCPESIFKQAVVNNASDGLLILAIRVFDPDNHAGTNPFYSRPVSEEKNILEMRDCVFVKITMDEIPWVETRTGLQILQNHYILPYSDFVFGDTERVVWLCEDNYFKLFEGPKDDSEPLWRLFTVTKYYVILLVIQRCCF